MVNEIVNKLVTDVEQQNQHKLNQIQKIHNKKQQNEQMTYT